MRVYEVDAEVRAALLNTEGHGLVITDHGTGPVIDAAAADLVFDASEWTETVLLWPPVAPQVALASRLAVVDKLDTLTDHTVAEVAPLFDPWRQPQGAHDAYPEGAIVRHHGTLWRSTTADNVWQPGEAGWHRYGASPDDGPQPWVQPSGAADAYPAGAQVTHNGDTWTSDLDGNVWEPGVYGWTAT